jgi:hypothetical protein
VPAVVTIAALLRSGLPLLGEMFRNSLLRFNNPDRRISFPQRLSSIMRTIKARTSGINEQLGTKGRQKFRRDMRLAVA